MYPFTKAYPCFYHHRPRDYQSTPKIHYYYYSLSPNHCSDSIIVATEY